MIFFNFLEYYVEEIILFENIVLIKFIEIIYVLICMYIFGEIINRRLLT